MSRERGAAAAGGPAAGSRPDRLAIAWVSWRSRSGDSSVSISTAQFRCQLSRGDPISGHGVVSRNLRARHDADCRLRAEQGQRRIEGAADGRQVRAEREEDAPRLPAPRHAHAGHGGFERRGDLARPPSPHGRAAPGGAPREGPARRSIRWNRSLVPIDTTRCTTCP